MRIMGIMNRTRGMQIVEYGFNLRTMFLLLGLLLSFVNLPIASGENGPPPSQGNPEQPLTAPPPTPGGLSPAGVTVPPGPPTPSGPPLGPSSPPPSPVVPSPTPGASPSPPPPPPSTPQSTPIVKTGGNTWNESEKAGVVISSIAALLQVAVVAFLLIKRHQMLTTVEYDDIEDLEYDTPPDSNFRDIESA